MRWVVGVAATLAAMTLAVVLGLRHEPKGCDLVGLDSSNVSLEVPGPGWTIAEFCVSGDCETTDRVKVGDDSKRHPFTVSLINDQGHTIDASGEVTTVEVQPNGEGCPPRHAFAGVSVAADGTVTTSTP